MSSSYGPKLRSRKHGAAVPLDELDKRLLNLMQGSFPLAPRPYAHVAAKAEITEEQVLEFCRARLAAHEVPWTVTFVDRLPRSSVAKLLRHELASLAAVPRTNPLT